MATGGVTFLFTKYFLNRYFPGRWFGRRGAGDDELIEIAIHNVSFWFEAILTMIVFVATLKALPTTWSWIPSVALSSIAATAFFVMGIHWSGVHENSNRALADPALSLSEICARLRGVFYYPAGGDDWDALNEMHAMRGLSSAVYVDPDYAPTKRLAGIPHPDDVTLVTGSADTAELSSRGKPEVGYVYLHSPGIFGELSNDPAFYVQVLLQLSVGGVLEVDTYSEARRPLLFLDEAAHSQLPLLGLRVLHSEPAKYIYFFQKMNEPTESHQALEQLISTDRALAKLEAMLTQMSSYWDENDVRSFVAALEYLPTVITRPEDRRFYIERVKELLQAARAKQMILPAPLQAWLDRGSSSSKFISCITLACALTFGWTATANTVARAQVVSTTPMATPKEIEAELVKMIRAGDPRLAQVVDVETLADGLARSKKLDFRRDENRRWIRDLTRRIIQTVPPVKGHYRYFPFSELENLLNGPSLDLNQQGADVIVRILRESGADGLRFTRIALGKRRFDQLDKNIPISIEIVN